MNGAAPFTPRMIVILILAGLIAFASAVYLTVFGGHPATSGTNSYSVSAVGHRALGEFLQSRDIPVIVSRFNSTDKAGHDALLVMAEPYVPNFAGHQLFSTARSTLLVLPKWITEPHPDRRGWIGGARMLPKEFVEKFLGHFLRGGEIHRGKRSAQWTGTNPSTNRLFRNRLPGNAPWRERIRTNSAPVIDSPQYFRSDGIAPIIAGPEGILVGGLVKNGKTLFIISDPDLISNWGIGRGENAGIVLDLIYLMRPPGGTVIIDETIHGFQQIPSFWRLFFELPFAAATLLAAAALMVLIWASAARFGAPRPPKPVARTDKLGLIDNTAALLHQAGHHGDMAETYAAIVLRRISRSLHAPRDLTAIALLDWIDRVGAARGARSTYRHLVKQIRMPAHATGGARLLSAVQQLHDWKQEVLHGPGRR